MERPEGIKGEYLLGCLVPKFLIPTILLNGLILALSILGASF